MINVFEQSNIPKAIIRLAIPAVLTTLLTVFYNMLDTDFIAIIVGLLMYIITYKKLIKDSKSKGKIFTSI